MSLSAYPDLQFTTPNAVPAVVSHARQEDRIKAALGLPMERVIPKVSRKMLRRYYESLSAHLRFPFVVHYPEPTNPREEREFCCVVQSLLDPETLGDEFDGLFCKTRKGEYELNLPLIELEIRQNSRNFQLIEDYWYWLWNWR